MSIGKGFRPLFLAVLFVGIATGELSAATVGGPPVAVFDTQLTALGLTGGPYNMPLGANFSGLQTNIAITLDPNHPSVGQARVFNESGTASGIQPGNNYRVDSFFDLFLQITMTTTDPGGFFGNPAMHALQLNSHGNMESIYDATATADASHNYGLFPPTLDNPYRGNLDNIKVNRTRASDPDGDGDFIILSFDGVQHNVDGKNAYFIQNPDGSVSAASNSFFSLAGAVSDSTTDPPFTIGMGGTGPFDNPGRLFGPVTAQSQLESVPEPATLTLAAFGVAGVFGYAYRRRGKPS